MLTNHFSTLLEQVRTFIADEAPRYEEELYRTERLPEGMRSRMAELGLFGMNIPAEWGGLGLTALQTCRVVEAICHGPQSLARWAGPGAAWATGARDDSRMRALADRYVPAVLEGHARIAFTLTEPGAGSDAAAISTKAERRGDVYVLNGHKYLISFAGATALYLVFAKTDPDAGAYGVTAFLVPAELPGLDDSRVQPKLGLDGMPVGEVVFTDCAVPESHRLGEEGQGFRIAMQGLDAGRLQLIAAPAIGAAHAVLDRCVRRVQSGDFHGEAEWASTALADMATQLEAARAMVYDCAARLDAGDSITQEAAMCKLFCAEMNDMVADTGMQLFGAEALAHEHPVNRFYRSARLGRVWDGTSEIQRFIIARSLLKQ